MPCVCFPFFSEGFAVQNLSSSVQGQLLSGVLCSWLCGLNQEEEDTLFVYLAQIWLLNLRNPPTLFDILTDIDTYQYLCQAVGVFSTTLRILVIEASAAAWQLLPTKRGSTKASPRVPRNGIKPQGGTRCWPTPVAVGDPCFYQAARMWQQ